MAYILTHISTVFQRIRKSLHIFMIVSPSGPSFRQNCRVYSSMISSCTIDWYERWPAEALLVVANSILRKNVDLENREVNVTCLKIIIIIQGKVPFVNRVRQYHLSEEL